MVVLKKRSCTIGWRGIDTKFLEICSVYVLENEEDDVKGKGRKEEDMRNVSDKSHRENKKKHILCAVILFFPLKPCRSSVWNIVI